MQCRFQIRLFKKSKTCQTNKSKLIIDTNKDLTSSLCLKGKRLVDIFRIVEDGLKTIDEQVFFANRFS